VTTFALVGTGFRAQMFLDVARTLGTVRCAGAVVRTPRSLEVPTFASLDACVRELRPDFVLTTTPRSVTPGVIADAVERGVPVLAETPPAPDLDGLRALWSAVGASGLVQVAEQYLMMPSHAARAALVASGAIGTPTQVHVSSTQEYHAVSLIRGLLGAGRGPVSVRASRFTAPLVSPLGRAGWTDDEVVRMTGPRTLVRTPLVRRQTGHDLDLIGYDTEHITFGDEALYRNPYPGRRWMDEEIAVATLLERMADWVHGNGPEPYPLADGIQDQQVALAITESADHDTTVTTSREAWS